MSNAPHYGASVAVGVGVGVSVGTDIVGVDVGVGVAVGAVVGERVAVGGTGVAVGFFTTMFTDKVAPNKFFPSEKRQELVYVPGSSGAPIATESSDQLPTGTFF
jgi:hypothetical protein